LGVFIGREHQAENGRFTGIKTVAKKTTRAKAGGTSGSKSSSQQQQGAQRRVIVFISLLTVMTVTSAILLALAPAPLTPGAAASLFAVGTPESLDAVFRTPVAVQPGRWTSIYIHHSRTSGGSAASLGESADGLADHFVIGNGDGCGDGEVQVAQRWHHQKRAGRVAGLESIDPSCISICLIGDFNRARPTPTQVLRLTQLVAALQERCGIPAGNVWLVEGEASPAGVGRYFPVKEVRTQLLP
jgi:hypothetical protein